MDKVVEFRPKKDEEIAAYTCECGSRFWRMWTDGTIICADCEEEPELVVTER